MERRKRVQSCSPIAASGWLVLPLDRTPRKSAELGGRRERGSSAVRAASACVSARGRSVRRVDDERDEYLRHLDLSILYGARFDWCELRAVPRVGVFGNN